MEIPSFQPGTTVMFTWVSSVEPDGNPTFVVENSSLSPISTIVSQRSGDTQFWALFTMPDSGPQYMRARWFAQKTLIGSTYEFSKAFPFKVEPVSLP